MYDVCYVLYRVISNISADIVPCCTQVYVHRSGRTARANNKGTTISLVAPQDEAFHRGVCQAQGLATLPPYRVDLGALPELKNHVTLARKIFTKSFVLSQKQKSNNWLRDTARGTDLDIDDDMFDQVEDHDQSAIVDEETGERIPISDALRSQLDAIDRDRKTLKAMVAASAAPTAGKLIPGAKQGSRASTMQGLVAPQQRRRGGAFIVVAK
jgi:superfamily II DNA/RNA helicase